MNIDDLIPMANRIAQFFATQPPAETQHTAVAEHLRLFWAPVMRQSLIDYVDELANDSDTGGLHPLVLAAVRNDRVLLQPAD